MIYATILLIWTIASGCWMLSNAPHQPDYAPSKLRSVLTFIISIPAMIISYIVVGILYVVGYRGDSHF